MHVQQGDNVDKIAFQPDAVQVRDTESRSG